MYTYIYIYIYIHICRDLKGSSVKRDCWAESVHATISPTAPPSTTCVKGFVLSVS